MFVYPELKILKETLEENPSKILGENLWNYSNRILIIGDEQSGKSSLAKRLFLDAFSCGFLPLLIDGASIKTSKIEDQISKLISSTYCFISAEEFLQKPNLVCIVDDISASTLNKKAKSKVLTSLNSIFTCTILLAEDFFRFVAPDFPELDDYKKLEILPFGHVRRAKLIDKWVALELTEEADDLQIWTKTDELRLHVESLVGKNVVPAKPFHILMLLQSFEMITTQRLELTAYGHCYQYLIYQALERVNVKQTEIDTYLNVLSELGRAILESSLESLDKSALSIFFKEYSINFLPVDQDKVIRDLINSSILQIFDNNIKFRYRYLFYFFAAKNLADSLHRGNNSKNKIKNLVDNIHLEKASNIVLFLTHHSKDPWIIEEILVSIMDIFSNEVEVTLEADSLSFIQNFVKEIPDLVLENRDARRERLKNDEDQDFIEQYESNNQHVDENEEQSEFIAKINKVFRATEVCGQILRNRLGSLERTSLEFIYEESLSVSLRFLSVFLRFSDSVKEESLRRLNKTIDQNPKLPNSKVIKQIESFYLGINYMVILGMLYKIAFSLGSTKGREIYTKVSESKKTPVLYLIQEIIELHFEKKIDFGKIEKLHSQFSKNYICDRFLKQILLHHCYMHDIGYRERQKLANMLNISMQTQRSIMIASNKS